MNPPKWLRKRKNKITNALSSWAALSPWVALSSWATRTTSALPATPTNSRIPPAIRTIRRRARILQSGGICASRWAGACPWQRPFD